MGIDDRYRAADDEAQLEYIIEWRERKRSKKNQRKMYRREAAFHFRMFWNMLFSYFKGV